MTSPNYRRAELIAASIADDLTVSEKRELREMAAVDPTVDAEIAELSAVVGRVSVQREWVEATPDESLRRRVIGRPPGRRYAVVAAAAGVGLLAGVVGVLGVQRLVSEDVTGPPGTLGAYEQVEFDESAPGLAVDGGLVAHTWGTETVLDVTGVVTDEVYGVFLREASGESVPAGTFLGTTVPVDCRMNAALDRSDVVGLEIRTAGGDVVAAAQVPSVT